MLLEQLAKKGNLNLDFHNHLHTGSVLRQKGKPKDFKEWIKNLFLEEGFSSLAGIFDRVMQTPLDGLYVTNSNYDSRYEDWTSKEQIEIARKAGYEVEQGEYFIFFKKNNKVKFLGKSHETATNQGHALFAQLARGKRFSVKKSLDETVAEATDNELKIADHPYVKLKGQNGIMAYSENPEKDAKKVDAFERNGNFYFPFSLADWKAVRYSRIYNKPLIADSDGHHPRDIGETYNIFSSKYLNYTSERAFRDSITNAVRSGKFESHYKTIPIWRIFHHALMIGIHYIFDRVDRPKAK